MIWPPASSTTLVTQERLREVEASDEPGFDRKLWAALAEAGLLGVAIPEEAGGLGLRRLRGVANPRSR